MNCREARSLFSARIDGELEWNRGCSLEDHLTDCTPCAREYRSLASTVDLLHGLPAPAPESAFVGQVFDRIRRHEAIERVTARRRPNRARSWIGSVVQGLLPERWSAAVPLAAALALGVATGLLLFRPGAQSPHVPFMPREVAQSVTPGSAVLTVSPTVAGEAREGSDTALGTANPSPTTAPLGVAPSGPVEVLTPEWWNPNAPDSPVRQVGSRDGQARVTF